MSAEIEKFMCLRRCAREEEEAATRSGKELHRDELRVPVCHVSSPWSLVFNVLTVSELWHFNTMVRLSLFHRHTKN